MDLVRKHRYSIPLVMFLFAGLVGVALWRAAHAAPTPVNVTVVSAPGDPFSDTLGLNGNAVLTYGHAGCSAVNGDGFCIGGPWPTIAGAHWIWETQQTAGSQDKLPVTFTKVFTLGANATSITGSIQITADNHFVLYVNGAQIGHGDNFASIPTFDISSYLHAGPTQNVIEVVGTNDCSTKVPCGTTDSFGNPAGIIFRADISYIPDSTAPTTTATLSGTQGSHDWYRGPVTLSLQASDPDDDSGSLSTSDSIDGGATWQTYQSPLSFSADGQYSVQFRSTDLAGNQEVAQTVSFKIDQTPPTLNVVGAPSGTYDFCAGTIPSRPTFAPADNLSGLDGTQGDSWTAPTAASGAGTYTYAAHAQDVAGNLSSDTRTYAVQYGAAFDATLPPLNPDGSRSVNFGSTIPVKFQLLCNGTTVTNATAKLTAQRVGGTDAPGAAISTSASTRGNAFRYDATSQQYIFNLSTQKGYIGADGHTYPYTAGTWTLFIQLDDGTSRSFDIQIVA
jgi:hypothetical protein